ncbi:efflux RND transporter periplasmic adaptor subunit [Croceibacterium selenioxidans]|nr:efflux RND transporter periplasmic adaptor subunit [Croceibacterium selenioxidans]
MTEMTANPTAGATMSVDEFLGTTERPRWRRWAKFWIPGVIVLLVALYFVNRDEKKPEYITEKVVERSLDIEVTATGNLRPTNQVEVGSEVSGRIDRVYVDVNDRVSRGQVLAQINTDVIEDQIKQSQANLQASRAQVAQARATLDVDSAQLARLQDVYRLSDGKVPSKTEMEAAEANVARSKASLNSAQANVTSAQAQLSSSLTNRDRALIRSPVSGVVLARQVEPGQTVAASFNTPTLFVLAEDLSQMQLRVSVDEADVGEVKQGQKATFTVDAYPGRQFPATVERVNLASNNTAQSSQQQQQGQQGNAVISYEARLTVDNANGLLRPGMTATANIATQQTGKRMLVPNGALRFEPPKAEATGGVQLNNGDDFGLEREEERATIGRGSRQTVHILQADGTLKPIEVVTGQSDGRFTVVTSNELKPGMTVVTSLKADKK